MYHLHRRLRLFLAFVPWNHVLGLSIVGILNLLPCSRPQFETSSSHTYSGSPDIVNTNLQISQTSTSRSGLKTRSCFSLILHYHIFHNFYAISYQMTGPKRSIRHHQKSKTGCSECRERKIKVSCTHNLSLSALLLELNYPNMTEMLPVMRSDDDAWLTSEWSAMSINLCARTAYGERQNVSSHLGLSVAHQKHDNLGYQRFPQVLPALIHLRWDRMETPTNGNIS